MVTAIGSFMIKRTQISNWYLKPDSLYLKILPSPLSWTYCNGGPLVQPSVSVRLQFHYAISTHHLSDGCIWMVCCCRYELQWFCNKGSNSYAFSGLYLLIALWVFFSPPWLVFFLQNCCCKRKDCTFSFHKVKGMLPSSYRHKHFCMFSWSMGI